MPTPTPAPAPSPPTPQPTSVPPAPPPPLRSRFPTRLLSFVGLLALMPRNVVSGEFTKFVREDRYSRSQAHFFLRTLRTSTKPHKVLLLPEPPPGALGGPDGSVLIGEIIDTLHPSLCVVAGMTERRGVQRVASTLVVNPGCLSDGSAAWLDWNQRSDDQVEFLED